MRRPSLLPLCGLAAALAVLAPVAAALDHAARQDRRPPPEPPAERGRQRDLADQVDRLRAETADLAARQRQQSRERDDRRAANARRGPALAAAAEQAARLERQAQDRQALVAALKDRQTAVEAERDRVGQALRTAEARARHLQERDRRPPPVTGCWVPAATATGRRTLFLECAGDRVAVRPGHPADFAPTAADLARLRGHLTALPRDGLIVLVVRPSGVAAFQALRHALARADQAVSWELAEEDWTLEFPADALAWPAAPRPTAPAVLAVPPLPGRPGWTPPAAVPAPAAPALTLECRAEGVTILPAGVPLLPADLAGTPGPDHPVARRVRELLPPPAVGAGPPHLRFVIRPGGQATYEKAAALLRPLNVSLSWERRP